MTGRTRALAQGLALTAAIGAVAAAPAAPASAAYAGQNGAIAFGGPGQDLPAALWTTNSDGARAAALAEFGYRAEAIAPAWSPDGTKLAVDLYRDRDGTAIAVMDADGGELRVVQEPEARPDAPPFAVPANVDRGPTWSPDGRRIAFARTYVSEDSRGETGLHVMDAAGGNLRRITSFGTEPAFSPAGTSLAITRCDGEYENAPSGCAIHLVGATGGASRALTDGSGEEQSPAWSPDGRRIAYESASGIWTMNADGSGKKLVVAGEVRDPAWSPDGASIVFAETTDDGSAMGQVNGDGTGRRVVKAFSSEHFTSFANPDWQVRPGTAPAAPAAPHTPAAPAAPKVAESPAAPAAARPEPATTPAPATPAAPLTPAASAAPAKMAVTDRSATVRRGVLALEVSCPAAVPARASLSVRTARRVRQGARSARLELGRRSFSCKAAETVVRVAVPSRARRYLARAGRVSAEVTLRAPGASASTAKLSLSAR